MPFNLGMKAVTLTACMASSSLVDPVTLIRLSNEVQHFHHKMNHMMWIKFDVFERLKSVNKVLDLEAIPSENFEETIKVPESWPQQGKVQFKEASLRYRDNTDLVLKKIDLEIKAGNKVGIVGRTGSGKSTTALTLSRIIEIEEGIIEIDGIDISKVGLEKLRSKVTVIP